MSKSPSLEEVQAQVDEWIRTVGVRYFSELTNMAILTEEVGELARLMARQYGDQSFKAGEEGKDLAAFGEYWVFPPMLGATSSPIGEVLDPKTS